MILEIQNYTPLLPKLLDSEPRFVISYGSAGSSKSYSQAQCEIYKAINEKHKILIIRKVGATLKDSVIPLFIDTLLKPCGYPYEWQKSDRQLNLGNSSIIFRGLDDPEKIKSIQGITRIWVEEGSELTEDDFNQLNLRLRGADNLQMSITFNPIVETHWIKKTFFDSDRKDVVIFKTTYKDNPFIDEEYKRQLEMYKHIDVNYYNIYALGNWGKVGVKRPFLYAFDSQKHIGETSIIPGITIGLSFDFNVDPITCLAYQHTNNHLQIHKEFRLRDSDIFELCTEINTWLPKWAFVTVTGDASGNNRNAGVKGRKSYYETIREELGLNWEQFIVPSSNPSIMNSRVECNKALYKYKITIHPECKYLEMDMLYVEADETGQIDKKTDKRKSHLLDDFRYIVNSERIADLC